MSDTRYAAAPRALIDAISRDLIVAALFTAMLYGTHIWYADRGSMFVLIVGQALSFVLGFVILYLSHEWGHYIGARIGGANVPLGSGNGVLLGLFDPNKYSRCQFQFMALGGEVGYLVPALIFMPVFYDWPPLQGLAVAGATFIVQALYVDIPVLWAIHKGADIDATLAKGTAGPVILKKTGISWGLLSVVILAYGLLQ